MRRRSMKMITLMVFFSLIKFSYQENCVEEATAFYGSDVMINCSFDPNTLRIRWTYNDEDKILIEFVDDEKSGTGYENGEYDMERNGSLVIKDVNFTHEGNYRVLIIWGIDFKHNESNVKFSVVEHCPPYQTRRLGKDAVIVCHFKPNFTEVRWFSDTSVDIPLITRKGIVLSGPGIEKFIVTSNGSLIIRSVSEENTGNYTVIITDANNYTSRHQVIFSAGNAEQISTTQSHPNTQRDQTDGKEYGCPVTARGFYGSDAMINCRLGASLIHLYWFDSFNGNDLLISLDSGVKGGPGYIEKEYDVMENGSLVIKNVNFQHEHNYEVLIVTSEKDEQFEVTFSVIEHCPPHQRGFIGEITYIVCHFKPDFNEVIWFDDFSSGQPLIKRRGSEVDGPGNDKYTVTKNGSLLIPRISDEHSNTYTIILRDADNNNSTFNVDFVAESSCNVTSPPDNGHFTHIRKPVTLAKVGCNKGYRLSVSNYSVCKDGPEIADDPLFGSSPVCISDNVTEKASCSVTSPPDNAHLSHVDVTSTRPTLPSETTKNDDMGGCVAHEFCKNCKIVLIIASVFFPLLVVLNAVAILKLYFRKNNTQSSKHKLTEEEHKLRSQPRESSL